MENKSLLITLGVILVILIVAGAGFWLGFLTGKQTLTPEAVSATKVLSAVNSKTIMVSSFVASGKITNISGRVITLNHQGESLVIPIKDGAKITSFVFPKNGGVVPPAKNIEFKDLKTGDNVYINLNVLPDNSLQGSSVTVVPNL